MKVASSGRGAGQPLRLTVLLDTSGSMEREDRAASVRQAMTVLTSLLGPEDRVTLIGFARQPRLLAVNVAGDQAGQLAEIAAHTPPEGGTNMEEAIKLASQLALRHLVAGGQNRVVMLTDGAANLGDADPEQLSKLVEQLRQKGVSFDACGVGGDGFNDDILEALTRKGGGRYYLINSSRIRPAMDFRETARRRLSPRGGECEDAGPLQSLARRELPAHRLRERTAQAGGLPQQQGDRRATRGRGSGSGALPGAGIAGGRRRDRRGLRAFPGIPRMENRMVREQSWTIPYDARRPLRWTNPRPRCSSPRRLR